jgi:hypothetical protein
VIRAGKNVLERDDARGSTVLVDDDGEVARARAHVLERRPHRHRLGDEVRVDDFVADARGGLCGIPPLVLGYPKNSSKISTAVKSNSFPTILRSFVFAPRVLDD